MKRQEVGKLGETLARRFLEGKGYRVRETNFRCQYGEIDVVAEQKDYLVFVEVRTRSNLNFGTPEESITWKKKEKLVTLALEYINSHRGLPSLWRIDVVAVELDRAGKTRRIELIENAVMG